MQVTTVCFLARLGLRPSLRILLLSVVCILWIMPGRIQITLHWQQAAFLWLDQPQTCSLNFRLPASA